jgi:hypothetical protein
MDKTGKSGTSGDFFVIFPPPLPEHFSRSAGSNFTLPRRLFGKRRRR